MTYHLRGSELPHSKLTEDDVRLIRQLVAERTELVRRARQLRDESRKLSNRHIAEKFGVTSRTIERLLSGEQWGHVE